jgi:probable F420-dependent oxidoreductase
VKLGLFSANISARSSGSGAAATAKLAEEIGLESLWTGEHIVIPAYFNTPYPYDPSGKMPGAEGVDSPDIPDPLIWLAYAAAVTRTIRLATGVTVLPLRHPMVVAKQIATLDALSGGRFILGIGVGWLAEEFDALGVPFGDRGRRTDAYLEAMRALWTQDAASVSNPFIEFQDAICRPRPRSSIPIVVSGSSVAAARRTARVGDGWFPGAATADELAHWLAVLRNECRAVGRDPSDVELTVHDRNTEPDALSASIEEFVKAGVSRVLVTNLPADELQAVVAVLTDRFGVGTT